MKKFYSKIISLSIAFFAINFGLFSQVYTIKGQITDSTGAPLFGATAILKIMGDTSAAIVTGTSTDSLGNFTLKNIAPGNYGLRVLYTGYRLTRKRVSITDSNLDLGKIIMHSDGTILQSVDIKDKQIRVTQNGDTTQFNANAFKTKPDATAEDLVNKMPGVTNENGTIKVHGEEVKQVLVDGKPFLGDDPSAALKNMPADVVEQVQVYDKASDQSQFTGFDDGQAKKTINLVTKKSGMNGVFGKVYAGYGTEQLYNAGGSLNVFNNARRFTVIGMSNNINQQNFTTSDLFGLLGGGGGGRGMGGGGYSRGGGLASNLMVGNQGGLTTTNSFGLNYSDNWGKKVKVSGSYFFNDGLNKNITDLSRNYFTLADSTLFYKENDTATTHNINHRATFKLEYTIDSMNTLLFTPKFNSQFTDYSKQLDGGNYSAENVRQTMTSTKNTSQNMGYTFGSGITYRHRFSKPQRTLTFDVNLSYTPRTGKGTYNSLNQYSNDTTSLDQHSTLKSSSYSVSPSVSWTEPAGKKGQFLFNYNPSFSTNLLDKQTNNYNPLVNDYNSMDTSLTNKYQNNYYAHKAGINYRFVPNPKASLIVGAAYQYAILTGDETFPSTVKIEKTFQTILPTATYNFKFAQGKNLKIVYRTNTVAPTVSQLQDVVDNSNPLQLKTGNPSLSQDFEHTLISHYGKANMEKATGFFFFFYAGLTSHYIGNSTFIAGRDTTVNGVFLNRGSQISKPVNLNGSKNVRGFVTYTLVLAKIKCNLGINGMFSYAGTPSIINSVSNFANNYTVGPGLTLSSNISEKLDFSLSYSGNYNMIKNSVQTQSNNNYFSHTASLKFNWIFYKGFVFNTSLDQTYYSGLGQGYNSNYLLWNAYVGYKFLKDQSLEAKVSAFDILKQNTSVTRTVADTYIEDSHTNVLQQYFMLTVTYNIKKFKKPASPAPTPAPANGGSAPQK